MGFKWIKDIEDLIDKGNLKTALNRLDDILELKPNNKIALKKKAEIFYMSNQLTKSLSTYEKLINIYKIKEDPLKQFEIYKNIGDIYGLLENPSKVIRNYERALERFSNLDVNTQEQFFEEKILLLSDLAACYVKLKDYSEAIKHYQILLQIHIEFGPMEGIADNLFEIAMILYKQKFYGKSFKNFYESLKIYKELQYLSQEGIINYYLGKIIYLKNDFNEAYKHLDRALMLFTKIGFENPFEDIESNEYYIKAKTLWEDIRKRN